MGSLTESWEIREGLVSWTLRHLFSLSCPPPSFLSLNYKCPPTLGSGELWTERGMWGFHLLFINTGSGNTPHCQPNTPSLHLVPWQTGAAMTRYRAPDVPWMRGGGWQGLHPAAATYVRWWRQGGVRWDPCYCLSSVLYFSVSPFLLHLFLFFFSPTMFDFFSPTSAEVDFFLPLPSAVLFFY